MCQGFLVVSQTARRVVWELQCIPWLRIMSLGKSYYLDYAYSLHGDSLRTRMLATSLFNYLLLMSLLYSRILMVHTVIIIMFLINKMLLTLYRRSGGSPDDKQSTPPMDIYSNREQQQREKTQVIWWNTASRVIIALMEYCF